MKAVLDCYLQDIEGLKIRDVPKPNVVCPECGCTDAFFHCTRQDDHGTYDWGTLATCLRCKTPFSDWTQQTSEESEQQAEMELE